MGDLDRPCTRRQFFGAALAGLVNGAVVLTGLGAWLSGRRRPALSARHAAAARPEGVRPREAGR